MYVPAKLFISFNPLSSQKLYKDNIRPHFVDEKTEVKRD